MATGSAGEKGKEVPLNAKDNGKNNKDENNVIKSKKRKSEVWKEFEEVKLEDGTKKAKCIHCKALLKINAGGSTTQFIRHIKVCPIRQVNNKKQRQLAVEPKGIEGMVGNLVNYKYEKDRIRELMAKMVIVHEYPFKIMEHELFVVLLKALNPRFEGISRITLRSDCMKVFSTEKNKLKGMLEIIDRISLTADLWTSNQTIGYLCLTGHYMDSNWNLQKRILNFCPLPPPHTGFAIADCIFKCLVEWGIENKVSTITLDNASSNDLAVKNLKDNFSRKGKLFFKGKIFHVRCCAHVLNFMVQDGLSEIKFVLENVRESVKYFKMSPSRLHRFNEIVRQLELPYSKTMVLDVPTRWNSTYAMLESALLFREVFPLYQERDPYYQWLPSVEDWQQATEVCKILEIFHDATNAFSSVHYPTANLFLPEIWKIKQILSENLLDERDYIRDMVKKMKQKFDKYWGECNLLMAIAAILDPRYKMKLIEFCFPKIYPPSEAHVQINVVRKSLYELYSEYVASYASSSTASNNLQTSAGGGLGGSSGNATMGAFNGKSKSLTEFDLWAQESDTVLPSKSDLDVYLEEGRFVSKGDEKFDALQWWKSNTLKFRILSTMARDILSIPISTVASESAFSAGGRVLDQYRSSLKPETVEALICAGDWIRADLGVNKSLKHDDEIAQLEVCLE